MIFQKQNSLSLLLLKTFHYNLLWDSLPGLPLFILPSPQGSLSLAVCPWATRAFFRPLLLAVLSAASGPFHVWYSLPPASFLPSFPSSPSHVEEFTTQLWGKCLSEQGSPTTIFVESAESKVDFFRHQGVQVPPTWCVSNLQGQIETTCAFQEAEQTALLWAAL